MQGGAASLRGGADQASTSGNGITSRERGYRERLGDRGYARFEALKKAERQRVWDGMRFLARKRFEEGIMPSWFKQEWLDIEEAPTNTWWRQQGLSAYKQDTSWLGESAPSTSGGGGDDGSSSGGGPGGSGGGGGSGWRWWREEDPYWPMRDWGDHPMRWWTWGLAGLLAVGGLTVQAQTGSAQAAYLGFGSAALLGMSAVAMSDIRDSELGELGIKTAWAVCVVMSALDFTRQGLKPAQQQQQHDRSSIYSSSSGYNSSFRGTGWACFATAVMYMWTGMSGLSQYALPTNPGEAFKMFDIAQRHKVWDYWGYGSVTMRV